MMVSDRHEATARRFGSLTFRVGNVRERSSTKTLAKVQSCVMDSFHHEEHLGGVVTGPVYYTPRGFRGQAQRWRQAIHGEP